jgi:Bacterial Ig-like domain (group 2)
MINLLWSAVFTLMLLSGCGWNGTPTRDNEFTPLASIEISAVSPTIAAGTSTKLKVNGVFLGGLPAGDITDKVVWSNDAPTVAGFVTTASPNRVSGLIPGTVILTATVGSVSSTYLLTVSSATITAMTITPAAPTIAKGTNKQFLVSGDFSDSTTQDLTFDADWASSDTTVATVSDDPASKGFAQALLVGTSTISATFEGVSGSTLLTVTEPVLQSIAVTPADPSILTLSTGSFTANGTYSDGKTLDITSQVTWNSSNAVIATIAGSGTATTLAQGTTIIGATLGSISGTTNLKATGGNLNVDGITLSPAIQTLVKDTIGRIKATGTFSNGSTRDITGAIQWTVANPALATVTPPSGNLVLLNALAATPATTITATSGFLFATATLTVTAPQLVSIAIFTTSPELTVGPLTAGTSARFTVTATFSDGTTQTAQDVTTLSTWTSDNPTIATVGTSGIAAGRVTGVAAGSTIIRATYTNNGKTVSALVPAIVTVRSRILQILTISPVTSSVIAGNQVAFTALASYGDGTTKDVTEDTTWSIDKPNVVILADINNQPGVVVAVDSGSATLTASFGGKTPAQAATIIVTGP